MVTYLKLVIFETVDECKGKTPGKQKSGGFGKVARVPRHSQSLSPRVMFGSLVGM